MVVAVFQNTVEHSTDSRPVHNRTCILKNPTPVPPRKSSEKLSDGTLNTFAILKRDQAQ